MCGDLKKNKKNALTAFFWDLVRVIPTVIFSITLPGQWFTQSVVTLEVI